MRDSPVISTKKTMKIHSVIIWQILQTAMYVLIVQSVHIVDTV